MVPRTEFACPALPRTTQRLEARRCGCVGRVGKEGGPLLRIAGGGGPRPESPRGARVRAGALKESRLPGVASRGLPSPKPAGVASS